MTTATGPGPGRRVGPIIRLLAGLMGVIGLATLGAVASLVAMGSPRSFLNVGDLFGIACCFLMALYGLAIAVRGRTPSGVIPWK